MLLPNSFAGSQGSGPGGDAAWRNFVFSGRGNFPAFPFLSCTLQNEGVVRFSSLSHGS